jgi:hypothetical protein
MVIQPKEKLKSAPLRLTDEIRGKAKHFAKSHGVSESEVYRAIVEDFFSSSRQPLDDKQSTRGKHKGGAT